MRFLKALKVAKPSHSSKDRQEGFSLVELMIVVGIIGILAALAVPKFKKFQAKARAAEAGNVLNHIYTLQETYHLENDTYANVTATLGWDGSAFNCSDSNATALGLEISPCGSDKGLPRYGYSFSNVTTSTFTATAASGAGAVNKICPGKVAHTWSINQDRVLTFKSGSTTQRGFACGDDASSSP